MDPSGRHEQESPPGEIPEASLLALDPRETDRLRERMLFYACLLGGIVAPSFALLEASKPNMDVVERYALPGAGLLFLCLALLARKGLARWAEWGLIGTGAVLLLERLNHVLHEPNPGLERVLNGYELISWFPCFYLFTFVLFEKRRALFLCVGMVVASVLIVRDGVMGGLRGGLYAIDAHEFYASQIVCLVFVYLLSGLKERYVATQRLAIAMRTFAETDFLTSVYNRRALTQGLEREISRCERQSTQLAVILLDIDRFKQVNDTLGHDEGDRALRRVALLMDRNRRRSDFFGRWGGEEFLLVAPGLDLEGARSAAERLRAIIAESSHNARAAITASFGVSEYVHGDDVASLVSRADEALIRAKTCGRNRVEARAA